LLNRAGIEGPQWLPVACDTNVHSSVEISPEERRHYGNDVVFAGSYYPNRAELFERLVDFNLGIWGPGWEKLDQKSKLIGCIRGTYTPPSEWSKIYSASKIILATHYQDPERKIPVYQASPRIFEALACGAFVISDNQRDVFLLFKDSQHLVRFDGPNNLMEKIQYYINHYEERKKIADRGREEVIKNHTYVHRIEKLLSLIERH